ncbi:MAG: hypothetical protein IJ965_03885, partial [Campylobacter sp.]|nr:hypothetical protein [Campylobacter sp.]
VVLSIYDIFKNIYQLLKEPSWDNLTKVFKSAGKAIYNLIELPLKGIKALVDGLIERFPFLGVVLKPVQIIVDKIYQAFKAIGDLIANFSFDKLLESLSEIKKSLSGFLDKLNPLNLFSSDEKEQEPKQEKPRKYLFNGKEVSEDEYLAKTASFRKSRNRTSFQEKIQPLAVEAPKIEAPKIEAPAIEMPKIEIPKVEIQPIMAQAQAIPETPVAPMSSNITNNSNQNINNNNYNVTNNINQNISSATPKQLADSSNKIFINSINQQRQQRGSL